MALVSPHMDVAYTVCLRMLGTEQDARDAMQDALIRTLRQHRKFDPQRSFRPWFMTIVVNQCRNHRSSAWWRRVVRTVLPDRASPLADPEDCAVASERDNQVRRALMELPPLYREAITLFYLEDMSYAEMAEITGCKQSALKQRVRRGLVQLQQAFQVLYPNLELDCTDHEGS